MANSSHHYNNNLKEWLNEHFFYEVQMLDQSASQIDCFQKMGANLSANMALECFLVHIRNLLEFLSHKAHGKYARAIDFIPTWLEIKPKDKPQKKSYMNRLNAEIVHLWKDRITGTPEQKRWQIGQMYEEYLELVKLFLEHLPKELKGSNLQLLESEINRVQQTFISADISGSTASDTPPIIRHL